MSDSDNPSSYSDIQHALNAWNANEPGALDRLFKACQRRLRLMIHSMMTRYSRLLRWVEHEDVLQEVEIRLLRTLQSIEVKDTRSFLGLAATAIRRQLIDFIRKYHHHFNLETPGLDPTLPDGRPNVPAGVANHPDDAEGPWMEVELHELVSKLPDDLREVFELIYYHGMSHKEVADLLEVSESTSKRKYHDAKRLLGESLG